MADLQRYFFPLGVVAAIVGIYAALRKPAVGPTNSNQISPAGSGLPNFTPQAVSYQVNPPQLSQPTQLQLLQNPWDPNPALAENPQYQTPPPYLAFNFGPGHDLSKIPLTDDQIAQLNGNRPTQQDHGGSCGCGGGGGQGSCAGDPNHSVFPDGRGGYMATNGRQLIQKMNRQDPNWGPRAAYNMAGSDIDPASLPFRHQPTAGQAQIDQKGGVAAAPTQTFTPAAPGQGVVNNPNVSDSINPNIQPQFSTGALNQFGNQVLRLSGPAISRLTGTRWVS